MSDIKLAIMGASGRMGQALTRAVHDIEGCQIGGGTEQTGSPAIGRDVAEVAGLEPCGCLITDDPLELFTHVDGILDFTVPAATVAFAAFAAQARITHVVGTTGFTPEQEDKLLAASRHCPMIKAGNMSLGVNLLTALTQKVSAILDESFDIEIV